MAPADPGFGKTLLFTLAPGVNFIVTGAAAAAVGVLARVLLERGRLGRAVLRGLALAEHVTLTVLLVLMIGLSIVEIVYRNVFDRGFVWADPLLRHAVLWVGFMGAALATAHDHHINIDALSRLLKGSPARAVHALLRVLASIVCLLLANATYSLIRDEFEAGSKTVLDLPSWVLMIVMPSALSIMAYRFLLSAWRGRPDEDIPPVEVEPEAASPEPVTPAGLPTTESVS
jgi:TRAP-type C4-dicarboxylate transport system permease small subunit